MLKIPKNDLCRQARSCRDKTLKRVKRFGQSADKMQGRYRRETEDGFIGEGI